VFQDETNPNSGSKFYGSSQVVFALKAAGLVLIPFQAKVSLSSVDLLDPEPEPDSWANDYLCKVASAGLYEPVYP